MTVEEAWRLLESDRTRVALGYLVRRLKPESRCDLHLAVERPSNLPLLMIGLSPDAMPAPEPLPESRGIQIRTVAVPVDGTTRHTLQLRLTDIRYHDVFLVLIQDIVDHICAEPTDREVVAALVARLQRWRSFLERYLPEGLGEEAQRGLYGELWFLRQYLLPRRDAVTAVRAWTGPKGAAQDFQLPGRAIEIKATTTRQHQKLEINSERQLDDSAVGVLLLFHLSLDARPSTGETLPGIVRKLRTRLQDNPVAAAEFDELLLLTGYVDAQAARYEGTGYQRRQMHFWRVEGDFPRVVERDLRNGVGDVRYTILVAECMHYALSEASAIAVIAGRDHVG